MPTLADVKMRVAAGQPVTWNGYPYTDADRVAVVMMPGPVASSVWAVDESGAWLCLRWNGRRGAWLDITRDHPADGQRAFIVDGMVDTELRLCRDRYRWVPGPEHRGADVDWTRARLEHDLRVLAELRARFWAELYPGVSPESPRPLR